MQRKRRQQPFGALLEDHELDRLRQGERRLDQSIRDQLRQAIGDAHLEPQRPTGGLSLDALREFATQGEDLVGESEHRPTHLSEMKAPSRPLEQPFAQGTLERMDLTAHGGLRQTELDRGARHCPFAGHHPEIQEMMVVESFHDRGAYIAFTDELHPNFLVFLGVAIADGPHAWGTSPGKLGRKLLHGGHGVAHPSSLKGKGTFK